MSDALFDEIALTPPEALQVLSYFKLFNKTAQEPIRFAKEVAQHLTGAALGLLRKQIALARVAAFAPG